MYDQKDLALTQPDLSAKINQMMERSNDLSEVQDYDEANRIALQAWDLLPEPKGNWDLIGWIVDSIFHNCMKQQNYAEARKWAEIGLANRVSEDATSEYINMGMACFELHQPDTAFENFEKAYSLRKYMAFQGRPRKYWEFYIERRK